MKFLLTDVAVMSAFAGLMFALFAGAMFVLEFVLGDDKTFARAFLIAAGALNAITAAAYFGQKLI